MGCSWLHPPHVLRPAAATPPPRMHAVHGSLCAVEEALLEIRYFSGWDAPTIHACVAGGEWMEYVMQRDPVAGALVWRGALNTGAEPFDSGAVAEFVITDGAGDWDKSPDGENYRVYECGTYALREGQLQRLE